MERFAGQPLRANAKILVLGTPKLGNFVVLTPLLRALKRNNPTCELWYRGSERTADLEEACPWIDHRLDPDTNFPERTSWPVAIDLLINADAHNSASAELASRIGPRYVVGHALGVETGEHPLHQLARDPGWASRIYSNAMQVGSRAAASGNCTAGCVGSRRKTQNGWSCHGANRRSRSRPSS
ncbi:MAG: hypothetical protein NTW02_09780 [Cyanobium sp. LacPavin_0920_WC12_MAG_62_9]|nr:hypothetical protein [Cyanobium sp. LacPavin_0920_WC12_MAG_62_9]